MSKKLQANLMLLAAAMIWGAAFVAQSVSLDYVPPFTFLACRSALGGLVLLPVIALTKSKTALPQAAKTVSRKTLLLGGILCGTVLFIATSLQQFGLYYTTAGKSGFITALYVVLVPVLGLLLGRRARLSTWVSVLIAAASLYLLCLNESFSIGIGELLTMACALGFAFHIMTIDRFTSRVDGVKLSCLHFFVCAAWSGLLALLTETPTIAGIMQCWLPICYAGIASCGVAYTLQIMAQQHTSPAIASLLMSTESVFAVLFGAIILSERLSGREYVGCALMFGSILLAQLPQKQKASA